MPIFVKILLSIIVSTGVVLSFTSPDPIHAQESATGPTQEEIDAFLESANRTAPEITYHLVEITGIEKTRNEFNQVVANITAAPLQDSTEENEIALIYYQPERGGEEFDFSVGDRVIVNRTEFTDTGDVQWGINDRYRLPGMIAVFVAFIVLAIVFSGGKRGVAALGGLAFSLIMLVYVMVPRLADGGNPLFIGLGGALLISMVSMYLAHGFNRLTTTAVISTQLTIAFTMSVSWLAIEVSHLFGTGSEEGYILQQFTELGNLDLRGLLLVGMVIGALGVLDDVTTALTASIAELHNIKPTLSFNELFRSGLRIGREHITSLVNTLFMAYSGAALPVLLLFSVDARPLWVLLNTQFMAEEIIRAFVGSISLMVAVPVSAALAAYVYKTSIIPNFKILKK